MSFQNYLAGVMKGRKGGPTADEARKDFRKANEQLVLTLSR